jgi:hypothetical protein
VSYVVEANVQDDDLMAFRASLDKSQVTRFSSNADNSFIIVFYKQRFSAQSYESLAGE